MSTRVPERFVPSVRAAAARLKIAAAFAVYRDMHRRSKQQPCRACDVLAGQIENAALALDMANAAASDARRAEDDRLRAEVAW